jgi:hypothetical protein
MILTSGVAFAQGGASITGVVRDTSGAVLPGVTVEASSPVLIEKVRSTVTDGTGGYRIESLLPGTYTVTFTLTGFNTFKREGIELSGTFVASVNAEMKVGAVAETITVTGASPLIDVQSAQVQKVVTKDVVDAIPTGRLGINLAALQPGIILGAGGGVGVANTNALGSQDVGGTAGDTFTDLAIHGGKPAEQRQTIGGLSAATTIRFGESLSSSPSFTAMQEMSVNTSGADATMAAGGVQINYVPRDGGNTFKGLLFYTAANSSMQATNYSTIADDPVNSLQARGLRFKPGALKSIYDFNPGYGGPIKRDRLWWFASARWTKAENYVIQNYPNQNFTPGSTNPLLLNRATMSYVPALDKPQGTTVGGGGNFWEQTLRLTWQASAKNKFGFYYNNKKRSYRNALTTTSTEALNDTYFFPFSDNLIQWTAPMTNKLLLEAGFWRHQETWGSKQSATNLTDPLAVGVTDANPQSLTPGYVQLINNYHGRVGAMDTPSHNPNYRGNFNLSYVTGGHSFKAGVDLNGAFRWANTSSIIPYSYTVSTLANNGVGLGIPVPTGLSLRSDGCTDPLVRQVNGRLVGGHTTVQGTCPTLALNKVNSEGGVFVQDKWTMDRLTLSLGLRMDWFNSSNPEFALGPSLLTPNRNYTVPAFDTTRYRDWTPKVAAAYDVFGDGRTALKINLGKYVLGQALVVGGLASQPGYNVILTATRTWTDVNGNFIPDCDLTNPALQGPTQAGSNQQVDTCGAVTGNNLNFYSNQLNPNLAVDPDARYGWGKRPYSWEFSVSGQHELSQGVAVYGGYYRRWFGNFLVTDNLNVTANDYTAYSITPGLIPAAPATAGGQSLPGNIYTSGFYNVNSVIAANNFQGLSDTFFPGSNVYDHWNGFDIGVNARLPRGIIFQGGLSTGFQETDFCDVRDPAKASQFGGRSALIEELGANSLQTCHMKQNWLTQIKFLGSYTVPKVDVQIGATFQSIPGIEYSATYATINSDLARPVSQGGLGRLPTGAVSAAATTNHSLIPPGTLYGERLQQLDVRFGKVLRYGRTRAILGVDLFNVLNAATLSGASGVYATWLAPSQIVAPRLTKISLTFDF